MLYPRIIPCLLIHNNGLVKTIRFKEGKYVGDPLNAVKIFNEKEADELIVLDIDATVKGLEPNYSLIESLAAECRMPLCYGGGIKTVEQAKKVFALGVEKIAFSAAAIENPELIAEVSAQVGAQSVVVVLDIKKRKFTKKYDVYTHNAKHKHSLDIMSFITKCESYGMGELVINSIDNDGCMNGYDLDMIDKISSNLSVPLTVLGGAGSIDHLVQVINKHNLIGVACGSLFVFKGKYKAVLINYPSGIEKQQIFDAK